MNITEQQAVTDFSTLKHSNNFELGEYKVPCFITTRLTLCSPIWLLLFPLLNAVDDDVLVFIRLVSMLISRCNQDTYNAHYEVTSCRVRMKRQKIHVMCWVTTKDKYYYSSTCCRQQRVCSSWYDIISLLDSTKSFSNSFLFQTQTHWLMASLWVWLENE